MTDTHHPSTLQPQFRRRPRFNPEPSTSPPDVAPGPPATYEIGYGKPPRQHRFKPGKSGNPKGRPKGARGVNAMVRELLEQTTELTVRGKRRKVPYIQALLLKQLELASKGDQRALSELVKVYRTAVPEQDEDEGKVLAGAEAATAANDVDDPILAAYRALILEEVVAEREKKA